MHPALVVSLWTLLIVFGIALPGFVLGAWVLSAVREWATTPAPARPEGELKRA